MMKAISVASVLLPFSVYVVATPAIAEQTFPLVKPGPGLPSLASLNITSAKLYQEKPAPLSAGPFTLATDFDAFCGGGENDAALVDDVIACFNYLTGLGHQQCVVPPSGVTLCTSGTAQVNGAVYGTSGSASSYCSDVAYGVQWVFTNCNNGGLVEGSQAAGGNGNLIAVVGGICGSSVAPCDVEE